MGLVPLNNSVSENETIEVCVEITNGTVGCNVSVVLEVEDGSAQCKKKVFFFSLHA